MIRFDPNEYFMSELNRFIDQIDLVLNRLEDTFKNAEIIFSCVFERETWDELTTHMAHTLNWYIKFHRKHRVINLNGKIPSAFIKRDKVHFTNRGYQRFMDKSIGMLLEFYYRHNKISLSNHRRCGSMQ